MHNPKGLKSKLASTRGYKIRCSGQKLFRRESGRCLTRLVISSVDTIHNSKYDINL